MNKKIEWLKKGIEKITKKNKDNLPRLIKALQECDKIMEIKKEAKKKYNKEIEELNIQEATNILKEALEEITKEEQWKSKHKYGNR